VTALTVSLARPRGASLPLHWKLSPRATAARVGRGRWARRRSRHPVRSACRCARPRARTRVNHTLRPVAVFALPSLVACAEEPPPKPKTPMSAYVSTVAPTASPRPSRPTQADQFSAEEREMTANLQREYSIRCQSRADALACQRAGQVATGVAGGVMNLEDADRFLTRGCDLGHTDSCIAMAVTLQDRKTFVPSPSRAAAFTEKACRLGSDLGCAGYALDIWNGVLEPANPERGLAMLKRQCEGGGPQSCYILAGQMDSGALGYEAKEDARSYFVKACRLGSKLACDRLDK